MNIKEAKVLLTSERQNFRSRLAGFGVEDLWAAFRGRIAVVLSGGGARGAYEAGVLLAFQDAGLPTHILTATSVGSINAAAYAAHSASLVGNAEPLVDSWFDLSAPAIGIEWTRYVIVLAGLVAAVVGFGNLIREWLSGWSLVFIHLHDPRLTWLFLGLAGTSVLVLYDRIPYVGYAITNLLRRRSWKPDLRKLALSCLANATVWGMVFVLLVPAHIHTTPAVAFHDYPKASLFGLTLLVLGLLSLKLFRVRISLLSHKLLRLPLRSGLFPNFERIRFLREHIDVQKLAASPIRVVMAATNVQHGTERFFCNTSPSSLAADRGVDLAFVDTYITPHEDLIRALAASSALPIAYEPVSIGEELYTDGSVVAKQPIRPAIRLGADVLFLVMTHPDSQPRREIKTFVDLGLRSIDILMSQNLRTDLKTLNRINEICEERAARLGLRPEQLTIEIGSRLYRYLRVFTVRPASPLESAMLEFDPTAIGAAILLGYRDTCTAVAEFFAYASQEHGDGAKYVLRLGESWASVGDAHSSA